MVHLIFGGSSWGLLQNNKPHSARLPNFAPGVLPCGPHLAALEDAHRPRGPAARGQGAQSLGAREESRRRRHGMSTHGVEAICGNLRGVESETNKFVPSESWREADTSCHFSELAIFCVSRGS